MSDLRQFRFSFIMITIECIGSESAPVLSLGVLWIGVGLIHHACSICEDKTSYEQLKHRRKIVYLGHRRFLKKYHPYRRLKKAFNGY